MRAEEEHPSKSKLDPKDGAKGMAKQTERHTRTHAEHKPAHITHTHTRTHAHLWKANSLCLYVF